MGRSLRRVDIVGQVLDNYGDVGVCWRLARRLAALGYGVSLWLDDLVRLRRLRPTIDTHRLVQALDGFTLRHWSADAAPQIEAELVIAGFGCRLPEATLAQMAAMKPPPVWINLEYLSAESWVEHSHRLPSPHPRRALVEHFYFPGFTDATGGLLRECDLLAQRAAFDAEQRSSFLAQLGVAVPSNSLLVSLFCYPSAPIESLLQVMQRGSPVLCLVPEGVTVLAPIPGERTTQGALTLQGIPFLGPDDYDRLLWSCDLNFVRGEDSAIRAQWAAQPMVWQLYPQLEQAHLLKWDAFCVLYRRSLAHESAQTWRRFADWWNGAPAGAPDWQALVQALPVLKSHARHWQQQLAQRRELAQGLIEFAREIG